MAQFPSWAEFKEYKDFPVSLSILQLDPADRAVLRIAGKHIKGPDSPEACRISYFDFDAIKNLEVWRVSIDLSITDGL